MRSYLNFASKIRVKFPKKGGATEDCEAPKTEDVEVWNTEGRAFESWEMQFWLAGGLEM